MLAIISPSKTQDFSQCDIDIFSQTRQIESSNELIGILKNKSKSQIAKLMSISEKLSELNFDRFQNFQLPFTLKNAKQAILAFKGDVYSGLDAESIEEDKFDYLQNSLRIISGYYGLLRPFDQILPYRLEMGTKLENENGNNLYKFWGDKITDVLNEDLDKNDIIVNLASDEYFKSINRGKIKSKIITPVFKEFKNGLYKVIAIYAKKARGLMSRFLIERKSTSIDDIKLFNIDGYSFDSNLSNDSQLVFTR